MRNKWTESDLNLLKTCYGNPAPLPEELTSRHSHDSIKCMASRFGIKRPGWGTFWTPEEDALLLDWWLHYRDIPPELHKNHSYGAIYQRGRRLGIPRPEPFMRPLKEIRRLERTPSSVEAAYLAGIIDGEGSLFLTGKNRRQTELCVANTSIELMKWLKATVPGSTYYTRKHDNPKYKQSYLWVFRGQLRIYDLLAYVEPYLIEKRGKAQEMMSYIRNRLSFYFE